VTRNQRLLALAGAVVVAAGIVVGAIAFGGSSKKTPAATTSPTSASFLAGVSQHDDTLGKPGAPATLYVFEDPQCPYCREWSLDALPTVVADFVKTGRVKLAWRGIEVIGPNSVLGLRAAYAAGEQNRLWNLVDQLYQRQGPENSGWITTSLLRQAAAAAHVDAKKMLAALDSKAVTAKLRLAAREASAYGINGTPMFVLLRPPGLPHKVNVTGLDATSFSADLSAALE
jgi:protein-disulfide isomerase